MNTCPLCNQGLLHRAIVKKTNDIIKICDECDAIWNDHEMVCCENGNAFWAYAEKVNIKPVWEELVLLEE